MLNLILLVLALICVIPTYGLSLVIFFVIVYLQKRVRAKVEVKSELYDIRKQRALSRIELRLQVAEDLWDFTFKAPEPTWYKNDRLDEFLAPTRRMLARKGLPLSVISKIYTDVAFLNFMSSLAGIFEQEGGSFIEQQIFVVEYILDLYNNSKLDDYLGLPAQ